MLKSFQIKNFRLFQHIEVERLNRVNLIVGKNNSGKSTFLEAIILYASNAYPSVILDLVSSRQETWFGEAQPRIPKITNPIRHLFFGHQLPKLGAGENDDIELGEITSGAKVQIGIDTFQYELDNQEMIKTIRRVPPEDMTWFLDVYDIESFIVAREGKRSRILFKVDIDREMRRNGSDVFFDRKESDFKSIWQIVSTENVSNRRLAALWDLTSLTNLELEVISALHLIDDRVTGVAFVEDVSGGSSGGNRIPLVKIKGIEEPLPLKSMGDGMTRLFHIVVALVNAKNGILLIDEFENGLHWSVQPKIWDIVFQLSEKLNVQIFATTHSRDCILGFDKAWNKYPDLGSFFRLDNKDGSIKVTEYTLETLTDSLEMDVEVR